MLNKNPNEGFTFRLFERIHRYVQSFDILGIISVKRIFCFYKSKIHNFGDE